MAAACLTCGDTHRVVTAHTDVAGRTTYSAVPCPDCTGHAATADDRRQTPPPRAEPVVLTEPVCPRCRRRLRYLAGSTWICATGFPACGLAFVVPETPES